MWGPDSLTRSMEIWLLTLTDLGQPHSIRPETQCKELSGLQPISWPHSVLLHSARILYSQCPEGSLRVRRSTEKLNAAGSHPRFATSRWLGEHCSSPLMRCFLAIETETKEQCTQASRAPGTHASCALELQYAAFGSQDLQSLGALVVEAPAGTSPRGACHKVTNHHLEPCHRSHPESHHHWETTRELLNRRDAQLPQQTLPTTADVTRSCQ